MQKNIQKTGSYFSYIKATGGGVRGPKIMLSLSKRSHWAVKDVENRIKNIVPSPSYEFLKIAYNYSTREN